MLVFLDYDGVLHPDAVYRRLDGRIELQADGKLFMWATLLVELLEPFTDVNIVLSTSWVRNLGFRRAKNELPPALADRVIGATWHSAMARTSLDVIAWDEQNRYQQIAAYLHRHQGNQVWFAIDDDDVGWPEEQRCRLIHTDAMLGLSSEEVQSKIHSFLAKLTCM